ncbi:nucleoporin NDC1-like isoform X2 [Stegodyphus dumicola]|uniref:nucleoporin NDC1-like isoform X2 n=1 Tax=Stegodyphus dumicola TaxID=202533 RepID=UPI0015A8D8CC|nr:nucleoporin NDC1-like isoform X2 [Stegodyphus dumicola]
MLLLAKEHISSSLNILNMWFKDEVVLPRFVKSFFWMIVIQEIYIGALTLLLLVDLSGYPISGFIGWLLGFFHWKTFLYQLILSLTTVAFGLLNMRFYTVEKHISSTRFEKICKSLSPHCLQHFFATAVLGGIVAYYCNAVFYNFYIQHKTFIGSCFVLDNDFENYFVYGHGCYSGIMFSLKYFICNLYLVKFTLEQESKVQQITSRITELLKDSVTCVLKSIHWYYLLFIIFRPFLQNIFSVVGVQMSSSEYLIYSLIQPKLFLISLITGVVIFFNWSLYLCIFNACAAERYVFAIDAPVKGDRKLLSKELTCSDFDLLRYLAVLDLRLLAQYDSKRRQQIFAISHPGGHAHNWRALSDICISSVQNFVYKLNEYSVIAAASESKIIPPKGLTTIQEKIKNLTSEKQLPSFSDQVFLYFRKKAAVAYFFDELPNTKLMKLFASSEPLIWIIEALGFLVTASYTEDKYGVVQKSLSKIICLFLDLKMAEEKLPIGLVGIRTYIRDPQGRYDHIHQRLNLKTAVNNSLHRIAITFKYDIKILNIGTWKV